MKRNELKAAEPPVTTRHLVVQKLRQAIAWGRFQPGQRLIERELCELTGVGRTSIREAIRQLEAEGMVVTVPHRGPVVCRMEPEEAEQVYAVRALLEGYVGRICAANASEADVASLNGAVERLEEAARVEDKDALIAAKEDFYAALIHGCGNREVEKILTTLHNKISLLRFTSMTQAGRFPRSVEEVKAICRAIEARDSAAAEKACLDHIEAAAKIALEVLRRQKTGGSAGRQG